MAIKFQKQENKNTNNYLVPSGSHVARCYKMVHVGTREYEYNGEPKKKNSIWIYFELPNEVRVFDKDKGEQPMSINIEYNLTYYEAAKLFKHVNTWRGKTLTSQEIDDFEIDTLIGEPCMLSVTHNTSKNNGKTYANITGVSALPKGFECPEQVNESFIWDYDTNFDLVALNNFPQFFINMIKSTPEWDAKQNELLESELQSEIINQTNEEDNLPF